MALFLDRDGTLNVNTHYTHLIEDLYLCPGVLEFFQRLEHNQAHLKHLVPIIVTNQSGVAHGYYRIDECLALETELRTRIYHRTGHWLLESQFYHDWTTDEHSWTRKPNPGMLLQACVDHKIVPGYMIGDKPSDTSAGELAGCRLSLQVDSETSILDCLDLIERDLIEYLKPKHNVH